MVVTLLISPSNITLKHILKGNGNETRCLRRKLLTGKNKNLST